MDLSPKKKLIIALCVAIPVAFVLWAFTLILNSLFGVEVIGLVRWLTASILPCFFAYWGLKRNSLSNSGAVAGLFVGFLITLSSYAFLACLVAFFISSSKATKFRSHLKQKYERDFKEGGKRNWIQVLSNGIMATGISLLYLLDCGSGEQIIDMKRNYRCSWLSLALIGIFSSCNGDTWASELGPVVKFSQPYLITNWKAVPKGTNGGVSFAGLILSFCGGVAIGFAFFFAIYVTVPLRIWKAAPSQWPVVIIAGIAGLLGSLVDSLLGATLQFSGLDRDGILTEVPGPDVKHISGYPILDNNLVNLFSTVIIAFLFPYVVSCSS